MMTMTMTMTAPMTLTLTVLRMLMTATVTRYDDGVDVRWRVVSNELCCSWYLPSQPNDDALPSLPQIISSPVLSSAPKQFQYEYRTTLYKLTKLHR